MTVALTRCAPRSRDHPSPNDWTRAMIDLAGCRMLSLLLLLVPSWSFGQIAIDQHSRSGAAEGNGVLRLAGEYEVPGQSSVHFTIFRPDDDKAHDALLLLHGFEKDDYAWGLHQIVLAQAGLIAVAIDYDERASQAYYLNEVVAAVSILNESPRVEQVSICGTSFGGRVAFETVAKYPELGIVSAFLVYPSRPWVSAEEVAAVEAAVLDCVGGIDPLEPASHWIQRQVECYNPSIDYKLQIYDELEFPNEARHGYFFARAREFFNEVAIDSFVRGLDFMDWAHGVSPEPDWLDAPEILRREDLLGLGGIR